MKPIPDKLEGKTTIRFKGDYYYLPEYASGRDFWLSTEITPGEVPPDKRNPGIFEPQLLQIHTNDGRTYYRRCLPFIFWKVRGTESETEIDMKDDLVADYLCHLAHSRNV